MAFDGLTIEGCREAIRTKNGALRAVLLELPDPLAGTGTSLLGVPYVLKDIWDTKGMVTTGGSYRHRMRVPASSARPFEALLRTGAVMLGKSNLCDLAFSPESDNHLIGAVSNPHDLTRTAGGSTGGGAAAVATGMAGFDWGTDFGGSIRIPAAFCGVVGLRLSARAWPVERDHFPRLAPSFWSLCGMGPLARTVARAREVVVALSSLRTAMPPPAASKDDVLLYLPDAAHRQSWSGFEDDARKVLAAAGARTEVARGMPSASEVAELYDGYLSSHFEELIDGDDEMSVPEGIYAAFSGLLSGGRADKGIHPNTALLLVAAAVGRFTLYRDAARWEDALAHLREATARAWATGRLLVSPSATLPPPRHGKAAWQRKLLSFAKLGNLTDATCISVPMGRFAGGMPRGIQILGPPGSEEAVLDLAERLERAQSAPGPQSTSALRAVGRAAPGPQVAS